MRRQSAPRPVDVLEPRTLLSARVIDVYDPVTHANATGMVYDALRNRLYVPTGASTVLRYDLATDAMLEPWVLSTATLAATSQADLTQDGSALYVANGSGKAPDDALYRIDVETGSVSKTPLPESAIGSEHVDDVAVAADGSVFLAHLYGVYRYDPATGAVDHARLPDGAPLPLGFGDLSRTRDGRFVLINGNWSGRRGYLYDATTGALSPVPALTTDFAMAENAAFISPDGSHLLDSGGNVYDLPGGQPPRRLPLEHPWLPAAVGFGPTADTVFAVAVTGLEGAIVELSTDTLRTRRVIPLGIDLFHHQSVHSDQQVLVSPDGSRLFFNYRSGVRVYPLTFEPGGDAPDLVAQTNVSLPRGAFPGTGGRVTFRVTNAGTRTMAGSFTLRTVLSADDVYDPADVRLLTWEVRDARIEPGRSLRITAPFYFPVDAAGTTGRLLTWADAEDGVAETAEDNNVSAAVIAGGGKRGGGGAVDRTVVRVGLAGSDMGVGAPVVAGPLRRGRVASVRVELINTGDTTAAGAVVAGLLDPAAPADAEPVARSTPRRAIVRRGGSKVLQLRFTVPADLAPGAYGLGVLLVFLGPGREADAGNNGGAVSVSVV